MTPTPTSGAADLPEALRVPLDSLHADAGYLCGRLLNGSLTQEQVVESIRRRIDAAKLAAITAQAISAEPAEHVQNPAENEHVAGDVSGNGAGLNMSTPHARITELESQLAQRFDAADMATAAAQGFRDGVASIAANAEGPVVNRATVIEWLDANDIEVTDRQLGGLFHFSAPPTAQAEGWQSIETAPKEGVFLVFMQDEVRPARRMQVANWHPNVKIVGGLFAFDCAKVTHWMPLPPPPTSAEGVEHG